LTQVREKDWLAGVKHLLARAGALPWLSGPGIALGVLLICLPFALVEVPPLIDIPGHMGAAAIEAAGPGNPLEKYFTWKWVFTLNIGGGVLMKVLGAQFGILAAGWWSTVLATGLFAGGCLWTIRMLNPKGGHAAAWSLMFVFSFPLLTGFLNYILATGLALTAFGASLWLEKRNPRARAVMLVMAQPVAMLCHAIGGLLLALLVGAHAFGRAMDELPEGWRWRDLANREWLKSLDWKAIGLRLWQACWPLLATVITIALWKAFSPETKSVNIWRWDQKAWSFVLTLRDQSKLLDFGTSIIAGLLVLVGPFLGARWRWRQGLPALMVFVLFLAIPSDINGSSFVDIRLLPVAAMLGLGLQDWSRARKPEWAKWVAYSGMGLLALRLSVTAWSFAGYEDDYKKQLSALTHVEPGSRVLAFVEHSCLNESWRNTRRDHLASLASLYRQAWVNDNWAVPGLHMVVPRFRPGRNFTADPSEFVWSRRCAGGWRRTVDNALKFAPIERVDYVWLIDTGLPRTGDPRLQLVWQENRSMLFKVRRLGMPALQPKDL
jgi:hypothetical protein